MKKKKIERTGMRLGSWTIGKELRRVGKGHQPVYLCRCDCGTEKEVHWTNLCSGRSTRCSECKRKAALKYVEGFKDSGAEIVRVVERGRHRTFYVRCACGTIRIRKNAAPVSRHCRSCHPGLEPDKYGHLYTLYGETHNLINWGKKLGVGRWTLQARLNRGWPLDVALSTPRMTP